MKKTARNETERTGDTPQLSLALHELVRRDLREFVVSAGMAALAAVLEQERAAVCGPRYEHDPDRAAHRAGHDLGPAHARGPADAGAPPSRPWGQRPRGGAAYLAGVLLGGPPA